MCALKHVYVPGNDVRLCDCSGCPACTLRLVGGVNDGECFRAYHLKCLTPSLARKPKGDWSCPECQQHAADAAAADKGGTGNVTVYIPGFPGPATIPSITGGGSRSGGGGGAARVSMDTDTPVAPPAGPVGATDTTTTGNDMPSTTPAGAVGADDDTADNDTTTSTPAGAVGAVGAVGATYLRRSSRPSKNKTPAIFTMTSCTPTTATNSSTQLAFLAPHPWTTRPLWRLLWRLLTALLC